LFSAAIVTIQQQVLQPSAAAAAASMATTAYAVASSAVASIAIHLLCSSKFHSHIYCNYQQVLQPQHQPLQPQPIQQQVLQPPPQQKKRKKSAPNTSPSKGRKDRVKI